MGLVCGREVVRDETSITCSKFGTDLAGAKPVFRAHEALLLRSCESVRGIAVRWAADN